jgi:mono/diheme cytochrome c family protein
MTTRVIAGTFFVVATAVLLVYVAVNEPTRMASFSAAYEARSVETGAALFETNCIGCHGQQGQGIPGVAPALNHKALFDGTRLAEIGYSGTVQDFVRGTISSGRPIPSEGTNYPQRMPTWSQRFGGPLRDDQVDALVAFVMNWESTAPETAGAPEPAGPGVGADINTELPAGDPANGKTLTETLGCTACHITAAVGPGWLAEADPNGQGIGTRAEGRYQGADYTGQAASAAQYLHEAIVRPNDFLAPGFAAGLMPNTYGDTLTAQDLADIIAYLQTLK